MCTSSDNPTRRTVPVLHPRKLTALIIMCFILSALMVLLTASVAAVEEVSFTVNDAAELVRKAYEYHFYLEFACPGYRSETTRPYGYFPVEESELPGGSLAAFQEKAEQVLQKQYVDLLFTYNWSGSEWKEFVRDESGNLFWCSMGAVQYSPFYLHKNENPIESLEMSGSRAACRVILTVGSEQLKYTYYTCEFSVENGVWKITGGEYPRALTDLAYAIEIKDKHLFTSPATGDDTPRTLLFCTVAGLVSAFGAHAVLKRRREENR